MKIRALEELEERILDALRKVRGIPPTAEELWRRLGGCSVSEPTFRAALATLERQGRVVRIKENRYVLPAAADLVTGRIRINRQGKGFLQPDDPRLPEIVIPEHATGTALHEDRVLVRRNLQSKGLRPERPEPATGEVVQVLERRRTQLVGTLQRSARFTYVVPDDPHIPHDIYVPTVRVGHRTAHVGEKVVVALRDWPSREARPEGEIIEILGRPDAPGVDILAILRHYQLPTSFPAAVRREAEAFEDRLQPKELRGRVDLRHQLVVTIDPDDAKDFDDAIAVEPLPNGNWKLWVHIADVSHYVRPGTALDAEARRRGNSTYLVDRVIPMLPEVLSNELCSLKSGVDRLTKCVEITLSEKGQVLHSRFYSAVIRSRRRLTYEEALDLIRRPARDPISSMLQQAHRLARELRRRRFAQGALDLDFPEVKVRLDEQGRVVRVEMVVHDEAHQLIEEFMLLANEAVARRLRQLRRPALFRVHEPPDPARLEEYRQEVLAHNIPCGNLQKRGELQRLLERLNRNPLGPALKVGLLRSLMRAQYATEPLGHFGLNKADYTHFTSPIRRYADLVVHRALFEPVTVPSRIELDELAEHLSSMERNAADAERDSREVKLLAFLEQQLRSGQTVPYPALVTEIRNHGFFVDLPALGLGGLVPLSRLKDDFFVFDPSRNELRGRRTRRCIRLGDRLEVVVARVDRSKKQVDFEPAPVEGKSRRCGLGAAGTFKTEAFTAGARAGQRRARRAS
ncbi:MAG: ribonuclease R [Verrucomicrobiota bacterium]|nr:ribonuclease R [Limisphaera sp.]MDW8382617.1 ribonuclease R [Verrucomicrobiota bacterium]